MLNINPSAEMMQRLMPMLQGGGNSSLDMGMGDRMNPGMMGGFRGMGAGMPQPPPIDVGMGGMGGMNPGMNSGLLRPMMPPPAPTMPNPSVGASSPSMSMGDKMSTDRPGFWGKFNTIAQGLQPMVMQSLMNNRGGNSGGNSSSKFKKKKKPARPTSGMNQRSSRY